MKVDCARPHFIVWAGENALGDVVSSILGNEGVNTLTVHDKHEMFRFLEEFQPAIVILDESLPKILGFEVYEVIKRIDRFKDTNVILLSSRPQCIPGVDESIE
ncbi:MAG: response regulator, partial [Nitrospirae bacterium]|nr:response regulator [Nitrospirota bacterium]